MTREVEQKTGELYSGIFRKLDDEQWYAQGELLAEQLGLDAAQVSGKSVLDGGCGHGALVFRILKLGAAEVVGVDLEPAPKEEVFKDFSNVRFVKASLLNLPFESNLFDLVVSSGVLHHTADPEKGFHELARVLKPGGKLILGVYGKHGLFPWLLWIARLFTVKLPIIPEKLVSRFIDLLKLDPIIRYQILDYLYVPILRRYTPSQVKDMFRRHKIQNPDRVSNISKEKGREFTRRRTSYSYDYRTLKSKILFGHGFIVISGTNFGRIFPVNKNPVPEFEIDEDP